MNFVRKSLWFVLAVSVLSCNQEPRLVPLPCPEGGAGDQPVAFIGKDEKITKKDLASGEVIFELNRAALENYGHQMERLDKILSEKLFKREAGSLSVEEYTKKNIDSKVKDPSEAEITKFMHERLQQVPSDPAQVAEIKNRIRPFLKNQSMQEARQAHLDKLKKKYNVRTALAPELKSLPDGNLAVDTAPVFGKKDSKIVVVEFSDFECPACLRAFETVQKLKKDFGGKIKFQYRHFPLVRIHPHAMGAAIAAVCAQKEGKFWEFHDALFKNQRQLNEDDLKKYAQKIGLKKFDDCFKDPATKKAVEVDMNEAERVGVGSTPTFILNGKPISGAPPYDMFKQMIDAEAI
jgi:protein-disulfide isomerase